MGNTSRRDETIVLTDPRAIRAVAHPARLAILETLMGGGALTATECASVTGLSASATSYHLKALARWGVVERAHPRPDARERPWQATGRRLEVNSELLEQSSIAERAILTTFWDRDRTLITEFVAGEQDEDPRWRSLAELANGDYWLTPEETRQVSETIARDLAPYKARRAADRPPGARRVRVAYLLIPHPKRARED